jgi:ArsR family transcriptional regulator, arsenate/arsenite/antimonite-responsive transcriptional repressor
MDPTQFFKSLADDTRLKILMLIQLEGELCVGELVVALDDSQTKVSRHLALLRQCDLLLVRKQRQWAYYRLNPDLAFWMSKIIKLTTQSHLLLLQENIRKLKNMADGPDGLKNCCS